MFNTRFLAVVKDLNACNFISYQNGFYICKHSRVMCNLQLQCPTHPTFPYIFLVVKLNVLFGGKAWYFYYFKCSQLGYAKFYCWCECKLAILAYFSKTFSLDTSRTIKYRPTSYQVTKNMFLQSLNPAHTSGQSIVCRLYLVVSYFYRTVAH